MKKTLIFVTVIVLLVGMESFAQSEYDSLTTKLQSIQDLGYLPGFAVAIVNSEGVLYQKGFGHSDIETSKPFTVHSLQNIGSISKTLTGISLMQLQEQGKLSLDTPINDILPFKIVNPHCPDIPITIKHLASHTFLYMIQMIMKGPIFSLIKLN